MLFRSIGKPVEINALWYNALRAMAGFARKLKRPATAWDTAADRVRDGFGRFWNERAGHCRRSRASRTG